jgi:hypothetical protein
MLSWHSDGFPLARAKEYVALRRPTLINDILKQELLLDRRKVYQNLMVSAGRLRQAAGCLAGSGKTCSSLFACMQLLSVAGIVRFFRGLL